MGTLKFTYKSVSYKEDGKTYTDITLSPAEFAKFNVDLLDLGAINKDSTITNALAAAFDLVSCHA